MAGITLGENNYFIVKINTVKTEFMEYLLTRFSVKYPPGFIGKIKLKVKELNLEFVKLLICRL